MQRRHEVARGLRRGALAADLAGLHEAAHVLGEARVAAKPLLKGRLFGGCHGTVYVFAEEL
jgi:hypothetical protein